MIVFKRCQISGIETYLLAAQICWIGHVIRIDEHRIPKQIFYGQLIQGSWSWGGQFKTLQRHSKSQPEVMWQTIC